MVGKECCRLQRSSIHFVECLQVGLREINTNQNKRHMMKFVGKLSVLESHSSHIPTRFATVAQEIRFGGREEGCLTVKWVNVHMGVSA